MARTPAERAQIFVVLLCVVLYLAHYLVFVWPQPFYIEDSAISFAYARNLVDGEGLVPYPGGERVEGYSNALWAFLMAGWDLFGVEPWTSAKLMGAGFGAITLFFSWGIARRARPAAEDPLAVAAPILLACSTQFVVWNSSGLENSLFNVLLAGGIWSLVREIQEDRRAPWSAVAFFLLTMTRPEAVMYAALALLGRVLGTIARRQWAALPLWIVAFVVPFVGYNAWRYEYFAWPFPNTYYAKEKDFKPFFWTGGAWKQVRDYMTQYGIVYAAPLFVVAMTGLRTWRRWVGVVLLALFTLLVLWDGRTGIPASWAGNWSRTLSRNWSDARVWYLLGASVLLGLLTFGRRGWEARGLLWGAMCGGTFFVVATGADWMKGFRWFSLTSVPVFTLLGIGIGALAEALPLARAKFAGWLPGRAFWATPMIAALAFPNVNGSWNFANNPETAPRDIHKRVNYMTWVGKRLGLEDITLLDVDMGAHLWWTDWQVVDIAGLLDVPMAHHKKFNKAFITNYIFEERLPDFAHVHGAWAKTSKIHLNEKFEDDYIEIPGYPAGKRQLHVGNHVRKSHLVGNRYEGPPDRTVTFDGGVTLEGWEIPSPEIAPGGKLYVRTTWRGTPRETGFRVVAFLADDAGHVHTAEVAPGYDWYKPTEWQDGEHVYGRWSIPIPESLPKGTYDFGLVVLDEKTGAVLASLPASATAAGADGAGAEGAAADGAVPASDATSGPPRFMTGEWRIPGAVKIVSFDNAVAKADDDYAAALAQAGAGDCDGAAETFRNARRHIARNDKWYLAHVDELTEARVKCLVAKSAAEPTLIDQARILAEAHRLDHHAPEVVAAGPPLAQQLVAQGDQAKAAEDWDGAYHAYAAALSVDPTLSWTRRAAEEARDKWLGVDPEKPDPATPVRKSPAKKAPPKKTPFKKPGAAAEPKTAPPEGETPVEEPPADETPEGPAGGGDAED